MKRPIDLRSLLCAGSGRRRPRGGEAAQGAARTGTRRRVLPRLGIAFALLLGLVGAAVAPWGGATVEAAALGGGLYEVNGAVYGTPADGLVGGTTAGGQTLGGEDRLVALPACTVSSCPWLAAGTGAAGIGGPQTSCAEGDGLCWVELTSPETGACAVAPVLDLGPYFRGDNWWAPPAERVYALDQGLPAAEAAALGADLGFGPGGGEDGADLIGLERPPALSVAAGTWADLGLRSEEGAAPLRVRLLWQAGLFHREACGGGTGLPAENALSRTDLTLFAAPDGGEARRAVPAGRRVAVTGEPSGGFYPVTHGAVAGWASGEALLFDAGTPDALLYATDVVNLRAGPSLADEVLRELPAGTALSRTGQAVDGFVPVAHDGTVGWVAQAYVA